MVIRFRRPKFHFAACVFPVYKNARLVGICGRHPMHKGLCNNHVKQTVEYMEKNK